MSFGRSAQYLRDFSVYGKKAVANKTVKQEQPTNVKSTPKPVDGATSKPTNSNVGRGFGYR